MTTYEEFFARVAGFGPYPYQRRLGEEPWPTVLDVPTGLGKTAAVTLAWLHKRLTSDPHTGRRLVYCLPTRVLVDQTRDAAQAWLDAAASHFRDAGKAAPTVHVLRGGELDERWQGEPEHEAILIGTQDMLLSRALNRGYAMSRSRWPMHFALLNNDAFWVFDEIQLMGVGVETSAQLQAFRDALGVYGPSHSLWMSATVGAAQLDTVDHAMPTSGFATHRLSAADHALDQVTTRTRASKRVVFSELRLTSSTKAVEAAHLTALAAEVEAAHAERAGLTLVIMNSVHRARLLRQALESRVEPLALVHSRFRAADRRAQEALLHDPRSRVVIATQAIEAGVDVSCRTLFTELAPWPSLVQRIGRCNRAGEQTDAEVRIIDLVVEEDDALALPYETETMIQARELLRKLGDDASPAHLSAVAFTPPVKIRPVVRRRDVLQLFDTTPDLLGSDIDVSRFIRDDQNTDMQVFWRSFEAKPSGELARPDRDELCAVSIGAGRALIDDLKKQHKKAKPDKAFVFQAYGWDSTHGEWTHVDRPHPGQVVLLHVEAGAYDSRFGFTGEVGGTPVPVLDLSDSSSPASTDQLDADPRSYLGQWLDLTTHLGHVEREARRVAEALELPAVDALARAGRWHDVGKSHPEWQRKLVEPTTRQGRNPPPRADGLWAKSPHWLKPPRDARKYLRHELGSALAWLEHAPADEPDRELIAYLIAAHHGKVRMAIRSGPAEQPAPDQALFAHGIWQGDELPSVTLPTAFTVPPTTLALDAMKLGAGSWRERSDALLDQHGCFRLAMLETALRAADWRASRKETEGGYNE